MRKLLLATTAVTFVASAGSAFADTDTFDATVTTQAALTVTCSTNLRFGTLGVEPTNAETVVTLAADNASATPSFGTSDVYYISGAGPASCEVQNENDGDATATLAATGASFAGTTLSGVELSDGTNTLSATVELPKATAIGNETLHIGGSVTIEGSHTNHGVEYSDTITLTVTD